MTWYLWLSRSSRSQCSGRFRIERLTEHCDVAGIVVIGNKNFECAFRGWTKFAFNCAIGGKYFDRVTKWKLEHAVVKDIIVFILDFDPVTAVCTFLRRCSY